MIQNFDINVKQKCLAQPSSLISKSAKESLCGLPQLTECPFPGNSLESLLLLHNELSWFEKCTNRTQEVLPSQLSKIYVTTKQTSFKELKNKAASSEFLSSLEDPELENVGSSVDAVEHIPGPDCYHTSSLADLTKPGQFP